MWIGCWAIGLLGASPGVAAPSELDPSFGRMGEFALQTNSVCSSICPADAGASAQALALQPDGKLLVGGRSFDYQAYAEDAKSVLVRLNSGGTLDGTFGSGGLAQTPAFEVWHLYANADGSVTSVGVRRNDGSGEAVGIEHYTAFGAAAGAVQWFAVPFLAESAQIDSKGRLVVLMETTLRPYESKIMRFSPDGRPDRSFGKGGMISLASSEIDEASPAEPAAFALGKDDSVFVVATAYGIVGAEHKTGAVLYRFASNGKIDRSFGRGGMVALPASKGYDALALATAPNGSVVLGAGEDTMGASKQNRLRVARYTESGRPDSSFGFHGVATGSWDSISPDVVPRAIAFDARGDILIAGSNTFTPDPGSGGNSFLVRLTGNGFDCSFGSNGVVLSGWETNANAVMVQTDGRIVVAGEGNHDFTAIRYIGDGRPRTCPGEGKIRKSKRRRKQRRHH